MKTKTRPHFHVVGPDFEAQVAIADLTVLRDVLPGKCKPALTWALRNKQALMNKWNELS